MARISVIKKRPLTSIDVPMVRRCEGAKAGLEHHNYPDDLKRLKITTNVIIPSLMPSVPIGDNQTFSYKIFESF